MIETLLQMLSYSSYSEAGGSLVFQMLLMLNASRAAVEELSQMLMPLCYVCVLG